MRFREKLERFMLGRYGGDSLGWFLLILNIVVIITSLFFRGTVVYPILLGVNVLLVTLYLLRALSRQREKRAKENAVFLKAVTKTKEFFVRQFNRVRYIGKYRYRKCKHCKTFLRLPLKRGRHTVRCPKCGDSFDINIVL